MSIQPQNCDNNPEAVWRGTDGKAYKCVNGKAVEVSPDLLVIQGYQPPPETIIVNKKLYAIQNGNFIYIPDPDNADRNQELVTNPQEIAAIQQEIANKKNQKYLIYGGIGLALLLLLRK